MRIRNTGSNICPDFHTSTGWRSEVRCHLISLFVQFSTESDIDPFVVVGKAFLPTSFHFNGYNFLPPFAIQYILCAYFCLYFPLLRIFHSFYYYFSFNFIFFSFSSFFLFNSFALIVVNHSLLFCSWSDFCHHIFPSIPVYPWRETMEWQLKIWDTVPSSIV